jgi:hypothetical protein
MSWISPSHGSPRFTPILALVIGMFAPACAERSTPVAGPTQADVECAVTETWQRVSPNVQVDYLVGGQLATTLRPTVANSHEKSRWAVRGAAPQAQMTLVAQHLNTGETVQFAAEPVTEEDPTGLSDWGPTYYAEVVFRSTGCWRISTAGGRPADAIVIWVAKSRP